MMQKTLNTTIIILASLLILTNRCHAFAPKSTKTEGMHPTFSSISGHETSDFLFADTRQKLAMIPNTDMEAEVLTTMAHVTMDFSGFVSPSKNLLRLFAVLGRVFVISADYVIDHSIHPEELIIQLFLMSIAIKELVVDNPANSNQTK